MELGSEETILLSVIVPVAGFPNGEEPFNSWFNAKIDSRVEVIIVIDSDDQGLIVKINEKVSNSLNSNIIVLSSLARNPGGTRNIGLAKAKGKWTCFWDCDDYPLINQMLDIVEEAEKRNCQISIGNYLVEKHDNSQLQFMDVQAARDVCDLYLNPGIWRMAFKKDIIEDTVFPNLLMGEDQIFLFKILAKSPRMYFSTTNTYKYVLYLGNQLTKSPNALKDIALSFKECISIYRDYPSKNLAVGIYKMFLTSMKIGDTRMRGTSIIALLLLWMTNPSSFMYAPYSISAIARQR